MVQLGQTRLRRKHRSVGGWVVDRKHLSLTFAGKGIWYQIDLERCRTSAEVLDWICQIGGKAWATDAIIAGLVRALNYFLHPQANLCSFGHERGPINIRRILR